METPSINSRIQSNSEITYLDPRQAVRQRPQPCAEAHLPRTIAIKRFFLGPRLWTIPHDIELHLKDSHLEADHVPVTEPAGRC